MKKRECSVKGLDVECELSFVPHQNSEWHQPPQEEWRTYVHLIPRGGSQRRHSPCGLDVSGAWGGPFPVAMPVRAFSVVVELKWEEGENMPVFFPLLSQWGTEAEWEQPWASLCGFKSQPRRLPGCDLGRVVWPSGALVSSSRKHRKLCSQRPSWGCREDQYICVSKASTGFPSWWGEEGAHIYWQWSISIDTILCIVV